MAGNIRTTLDHLVKLVVCLAVVAAMNVTHRVHGDDVVPITYVSDAVEKGAVCNDGSPAAYYYSPGFGDGVNNWIVYLNGGGWCNTDENCAGRLKTEQGSSMFNGKSKYFGQITSSNPVENPDFYNWNRVEVVYCDGSSFMGKLDHPIVASRGARIFDAVMEELLQKGMANATNAIFSGGSAGGLAATLHCDGFRALLPNGEQVKCVIDSGFFVHAPKLHGAEIRAKMFAAIVEYHGFADNLSPSCTSTMNATLCIFPEYIVKNIQTPLFLVESKFDRYQMRSHSISSEYSTMGVCIDSDLKHCTPSNFQSIKDYGVAVTELLQGIRVSSSIGMFVHPCLRHGHFDDKLGWNESYKLNDKTIVQAIGDWFYDRSPLFQEIDSDHDSPWICN